MRMSKNIKWLFFLSAIILITGARRAQAQAIGASGELKWLRVNELHTYFSEQGAESETGGTERRNVTFSWPGQYGIIQSTMRANGMWLGCKDYYDAKVDKSFSYYVTNVGMKPNEYPTRPIFDAVEFKLVGRSEHPVVSVDGESASVNDLYDVDVEIDEQLPADRMLVVKNHTSIGVTVTKRVYAFTQQYHDNYYIYDYVLKNTGIIDNEGTINPQTLKDFRFYLLYRYALSGESVWDDVAGAQQGWGTNDSSWGKNVVNDVIGTDQMAPEFTDPNSPLYHLRANFAWYGPHSGRPVDIENDWGCPNQLEDGIMAAAKFVGNMTVHADYSPDNPSDDRTQPSTTFYLNTDSNVAKRVPSGSHYDESYMTQRYETMSNGHALKTHAQEIEEAGVAANDWNTATIPNGVTSVQGFGPYTLESGDSIHIVTAGGVSGISREKNREIGGNWFQYYNGTGTPQLIMPDGSITADYTGYKKAWVLTCRDSILQTFRNALMNYDSGYQIPQPPPPPKEFTVESGGDRIRLSWADNAASWPNFDGYVIYRSQGNVMDPKTEYSKLFECDASNVVHVYDDTSAARGNDYYYYIQSKDDGSTNNIEPGKPLYSGMFWTLTSEEARLRRKAESFLNQVRVVPNPYDIRSRLYQFGTESQYDRINFYGLPKFCKLKIFTERGDLILEKDHTNGSGDEIWDSMTSSRQIVVSGIYILYVEVSQDIIAEEDTYAWHDMYNDNQELMYREGKLLYSTGEQIFKKGESIYRKFVIIR